MSTAAAEAEKAVKKAQGRKDGDGTEAVIKTKPLKDAVHDLVVLKKKSDDAKDKLNEAVKVVAEKAGLLSSVVRKFVNARCGDNFEEEKRKVDQAAIVFDEIGAGD